MQVLVINGGNAFEKYDEYLEYLRNREISLDRLRSRDWKSRLSELLGPKYDILTPRMPNNNNARFLEWKIWFERIIPLLDDEAILVGHSLGGIFLAKYLSENTYPKKIRATLLVAAPYNTPTKHPLVDFNIVQSLDGLREQGGKIIIYHSQDDKVVRFANAMGYKKDLPEATLREFKDRGHFNTPTFSEIVDDIKVLSR